VDDEGAYDANEEAMMSAETRLREAQQEANAKAEAEKAQVHFNLCSTD
jgi:hypothetical protein